MTAPSFEDFFQRLCEVTDIENQSQLAEALGVGRAAISLAKQKDAVPWKWIFTLAQSYSLNSTWLANGKGAPSIDPDSAYTTWSGVPHAVVVHTEASRLELDKTDPRIGFSQHSAWPHPQQDLATLDMVGPCMEPEIRDMDLLLIDQSSRQIQPGLIYVLDLVGSLLVRRVDLTPRSMTLICDNTAFPPSRLLGKEADQVRILGQVMGVIRTFNPSLRTTSASCSDANRDTSVPDCPPHTL